MLESVAAQCTQMTSLRVAGKHMAALARRGSAESPADKPGDSGGGRRDGYYIAASALCWKYCSSLYGTAF